ncbi:4Fe-4S dicluster domain-containing protein [Labilibaculum sp. A4]|uniref:[Fe-Fe] hydrogenase large subunit C-terminal domain-containing protein n=1 Tax=Labilibaculum euxinus TaxID=2686357 RepID=UPI000F622965|nr:[Fe-Fe] hydrogenase large subunit C-terminal domain-containing protein [Labilibaculum euxinus]MDQ1769480.1 [Fe-Fe] hydrogenase large subunit C-terminal domain-containing protein [Labilibaculum euxinus]MWN75004.1 4Fe-4S dicluster domain-containing protein [Labilibaculum euxinus]
MEKAHFYHALKVVEKACIGCTHCMNVCPTSAIRVKNGIADINKNACVDCGECLNSCPVNAIIVEQDDFSQIFHYKQRVALLPTVLLGQFPDDISEKQIYSVILELGFTHVYEVDETADILTEVTKTYMQKHHQERPFISSFCPAIVRLIQVKFPALVEHIIHLKPVIDISAIFYREKLKNEGFSDDEVGIFYVTPCAAKIAAVKSPVGEDKSFIDGVINMDFIYNKVLLSIKQNKSKELKYELNKHISRRSIGWTLTNGEASQYSGRCLAIDEIHNVIEVLEKLENEEITDVDFVELRACDHSCAGGVLTTENRFLAIERLRKRADWYHRNKPIILEPKEIEEYRPYLLENISIKSIEPRSILSLDTDMMEAMKKMEKINRILKVLPSIDCGACGAPRCQALAEDVVQGKAKMTQCVFLQKMLTKEGLITPQESFDISENTWGVKRFEKKNINDH